LIRDDDGLDTRHGQDDGHHGALDDLPDDDFHHLIDAFLRNETDAATNRALTQPPLVERTRTVLGAMAASVGSQLEARAADIATLELERRGGEGLTDDQMHRMELDYARWRASALRFRGRLREVLAGLPDSRAERLEAAIRAHRDAIGDERDPPDHTLWTQID
jgi:hypothetical protein